MPKININEKDLTTPGGSSNYANYAVLLVGYEGEELSQAEIDKGETRHPTSQRLVEELRPVTSDSNDVYEFTSAQDFIETIGLASPRRAITIKTGDDKTDTYYSYHYGNRMAYELLNLGFAVLYKPIKSQEEIWNENTWEIFKDKVSYDFRFISHGLLASDETALTKVDGKGIKYIKAKNQLAKLIAKKFEEKPENEAAACFPDWKKYLKIEVDYKLYDDKLGYSALDRYTKKDINEDPVLPYIREESNDYRHSNDYAIERSLMHRDEFCKKMKCYSDTLGNADCLTHWGYIESDLKTIYSKWETNKPTNYEYNDLCDYIASNPNIDLSEIDKPTKAKSGDTRGDLIVTLWNTLGIEIDKLYNASLKFVKRTDINTANQVIANLAAYVADDRDPDETAANSGRGDCIALLELDENIYTKLAAYEKPEKQIIKGLQEMYLREGSGTYCTLTVPSVYYKSLENEPGSIWEGSSKMPASFHYLTCFLRALRQNYAEWYATAGYTRGVSSLVIDHTSVKLGELAINALEPRNKKDEANDPPFACNVIANFRGSYYLWGNRTCAPLGAFGSREKGDLVASHFLNIRQLCTTIKKKLFNACRQFTFDPNSDVLWVNFCNAIRPTLENMRADQGIRDYKILRVETDKKATLKAKIRIIPIEAVEDFILEVSLDDDFGVAITG
jgi:hypothetical protein